MAALQEWAKQNFTVDAPLPDKAVPLVTAGLAIATALLTAVGVGSGITVRILRNDPWWVALFVLVLLSSISLAAFAARRRWLVVAGAIFFLALGGFTWLAGNVSRAAERPHLAATAETTATGLTKISVTVKAEGLRTKELIYLLARGHTRVAIDPTTGDRMSRSSVDETPTGQAPTSSAPPELAPSASPGVLIKEAALGPNASGSIDASFAFEVSPALFKDVFVMASRDKGHVRSALGPSGPYEFECIQAPTASQDEETDDKLNRACVRFILPYGAIRPAVNASLGIPDAQGNRLLTTNIAGIGVPPSKAILLEAWLGKTLLMQQTLAPDLAGKIQVSPTVPLAKGEPDICIIAALVAFDASDAARAIGMDRSYCDQASVLPLTVGFARLQTANLRPER